MTTTGTAAFNPAITFIITSMYRKLGVINEDEQPTAGMYSDAMFAANSLVKEWMASGIHVWTEEEAIVFLQAGQARYLLGGTTTDNDTDANTWVLGTLATNSVAAATTVTLVTSAGITSGQKIGVALDSGTTQWTTVSGSPVGNVVTLGAALAGSASAGNYTFSYTTKILRPLRVPRARLLNYNGLLETPMNVFSRKEYMDLPNKASTGTSSAFFYNPALVSGEFYVWPVPLNSNTAARLTWYRPIFDFTNAASTADVPQEWINALVWNLAVELAPDFSIPAQRYAILKATADEKLELVRGWDREPQAIYFGVGYSENEGYPYR